MYGDPQRTVLITRTSAFVALITLGSWLSIPFFPVPFTLQTLFVLLSGAVMGRKGVIPVLLYLSLGMLNFPVFHNSLSGIGILLGPTGGYLLGFVPAALVTGLAYERRSSFVRLAGIVTGILVILGSGTVWLVYSTGMQPTYALIFGLLVFLPGDILKGACVYLTAKRLG
ncbi:MAG: biotin transporter BioY [Methanomicrobiales archaeon]|nr:biotin transporter BioY [Methanomicrobiales archaeon]